ncbi:hypothetical protein JKP88DRAFT_270219 [Tribonema minus]|uniref:Phytanoyl-CoA dioxygenase n=1 Tax=Tribonema minus TaxID=303371 RepID=A0A835YTQ3_9STRA|nr:hypothetical protein JKP88DRAFT_270219 [Tribonema minus]
MSSSGAKFSSSPFLTPEQVAAYHQDGYLVLPGFWSQQQVAGAKQAIGEVLAKMDLDESRTIFTTKEQNRAADEYFLGSGDKVRFFWEEDSFDGKTFKQERTQCINKIGHALHDLDPTFKQLSYDERIGRICKELGMSTPLACQSMYIFKQPRIGGQVRPHQDGAFLYTQPQSVIGFWWGLERCTLENGCLWAVPGSHRAGVTRRFRRCREGAPGCEFEPPEPVEWDTSAGVPLECDAGTLVILHNALVHYSLDNKSDKSRHAYTLHVVDGKPGIEYPADNWLQKPGGFNVIAG